MATNPPYLQPGDTIALVCPAGFMDMKDVEPCISILDNWGYKVRIGATVGKETGNYFSGTDKERLADLQLALDDREVAAILCARGGYGLSRIIDDLDFKKFRKHPKWIIGYSDITVLHAHVFSTYNIATLHAPMAAAFKDGLENNPYLLAWKRTIEGKTNRFIIPSHEFNRKGMAEGELVGGNLALLAHLIGSKSSYQTKDKIVFIEDIGEYAYNIDRMLYQLKRAGYFKKIKALVVGSFSDNKDTLRPFGKPVYEIIRDAVKEYDFPVCYDFPVGHTRENYPLKIGNTYSLKIGKNKVVLEG